tara:strand:+ start:289 stop:621 length:333 start_codon:yes stop_codon:yes gene_type:complete
MIKKLLLISSMLILTNCAAPGTALLTPVITGAKTKSLQQASLSLASSLGSNKIITDFKETNKDKLNKYYSKLSNKIVKNIPYVDKDPTILLAYNVDDVKISDVIEPEPLP